MGTKVQSKSYLPGYYSMRDLNEDANSCSWPLYYGDKNLSNGQYHNGFLPRATAEVYSGYNRDVVKQMMLHHEETFREQVCELHRLYEVQQKLMDEAKRKELHRSRIPNENSLSSSPLNSQITLEDARKLHSFCARPSMSVVEENHSPLSSVKGSGVKTGLLPFQNGDSSKDVELLDSRPRKVRRKLIDLQLPADEYIDTEEVEPSRDGTVSGTSTYLPNGNKKIGADSSVKLFVGNGEKGGDVMRSDSHFRRKNSLADLNEPIPVEDGNSNHLDLLSSASHAVQIRGNELLDRPKSHLLGLSKEISLNSCHGSSNGPLSSQNHVNNENGRTWFSHVLEAGPSKSNLNSLSHDLRRERSFTSSHPQAFFNRAQDSPTLLTDQSKVDPWRERTIQGSGIPERNHVLESTSHPDLGIASNISYQVASSSSHLFNPLSQSGQTHPFLSSSGNLSRNMQTSASTHGSIGEREYLNSNHRSNSSFGGELPNRNGICHGSSSGSKESPVQVPSVGYSYLNYNYTNVVASEHVTKPGSAKDLNLNAVLSNNSQETVPQKSVEVEDKVRKQDDHLLVPPWLKAKPTFNSDANSNSARDLNVGQSGSLQSSLKNSVNENIQNLKSGSGSNIVEGSRAEASDVPGNRKILGFTIFEKPLISKTDSSSLTSPSALVPPPSEVEVDNNRKNRVLDINVPYDPAVTDLTQPRDEAEVVVTGAKSEMKSASSRPSIDLNASMSEDEASVMLTILSGNVPSKGIDLEAPLTLESENDDVIPVEEHSKKAEKEPPQDEHVRVAAEAIVAISSSGPPNSVEKATCQSSEASPPAADPLSWFVQIISTLGENLESTEESASEEMDYFESMTLKLTESTEEEYMPKPLIPEHLKIEETTTPVVPNRPRKGQGRRGRQRRDFQRDILPGLASLSRHEVTEDIQMFGGLMRETGFSWQSGLSRRGSARNGCGRGRRRTVASQSAAMEVSAQQQQQINNVEVGLVEDRSLTGWGKTTRRPRRQRCPAGNPPTVPMT